MVVEEQTDGTLKIAIPDMGIVTFSKNDERDMTLAVGEAVVLYYINKKEHSAMPEWSKVQ